MRTFHRASPLIAVGAALTLFSCDYESTTGSPDSQATAAGVESASTLDSTSAGRRLRTHMDGASEVPGPGDEDGTGTASISLNPGRQRVCFDIDVANIEPATMAHIHVGAPDVAGPIVVPLPVGDPKPDHFSGCVEDVDRSLVRAIMRDPGGYYVNVHNAPFPAGAVRGQLGRQRGR